MIIYIRCSTQQFEQSRTITEHSKHVETYRTTQKHIATNQQLTNYKNRQPRETQQTCQTTQTSQNMPKHSHFWNTYHHNQKPEKSKHNVCV